MTKQSSVLDRDHRVRCKILHNRNLVLGKGTNLLAIDGQCSKQQTVLAERNNKSASCATQIHDCTPKWIAVAVRVLVHLINIVDEIFARE